MRCPICRQGHTHVVFRSYDDRYGFPGQFDLVKCYNCGHKFLDCVLASIKLTELYTSYYPRRSFDIGKSKPHVEKTGLRSWIDGINCSAFRWIPKNVSVLDIGCGFGESLGYHVNRGCTVYGVEADENIRRVADKYGYNVHVGLFNPDMYQVEYFDYVTMDQVIEHMVDPIETLIGVAKILKPGGIAVLSTPNANGWGVKTFKNRWINWHSPYHIQFFSKNSIRLAANKSGFKIIKILTLTSSEWLLYQWVHLFSFPQMGKRSEFWDTRKEKSLRLKLLIKVFSIFHKSKINHLITRIFDALNVGDNFVIILKKI